MFYFRRLVNAHAQLDSTSHHNGNKMADNSDLDLTEYETENESFEKEIPDDTESSSEDEISGHASMESVLKRKKKNTTKSTSASKKRPRPGPFMSAAGSQQGSTGHSSEGKKKNKACWTPRKLADVVDVVVNNESFKKKLIFTNTSNATNSRVYEGIIKEVHDRSTERGESFGFSTTQVRNKFKKLISECKKVALTTSTASGIKRFQDKFGKWFELLYPVVKQRESCDPDQSIEPCTEMTEGGTLLDNSVVLESSSREDGPGNSSRDDGPGSSREDGKSNEKEKREKLFIPKKQAHKRSRAMEELKTVVVSAMEKIDKTDNLIQYFQQENERARQHELQLFQMLTAANTPQPLTMQHTHQPLTMQHNVMQQGFPPPSSSSNVQSPAFQPMEMPPEPSRNFEGYMKIIESLNTFDHQETPYKKNC